MRGLKPRAGLSSSAGSFGDTRPRRFPGQPGLTKLTELGLQHEAGALVESKVSREHSHGLPGGGRDEQG